MAASVLLIALLVVGAAALSSGAVTGGNSKLKHIHLYMHETMSGPNATEGAFLSSPFGANVTFGQVAVFDDELRVGRDRVSPLVARYQGLIVGTGQSSPGYLSTSTIVFVSSEFNGSTLSVEGPVLSFKTTAERNIIVRSGKFRMARGYYLLKLLELTSPLTAVSEVDFFVLMYDARCP